MVRRLFVFFIGVIASLLIFELVLRFSGSFYQRSLPPQNSDAFTIICLGNSFTAGLGAPPGMSYCDQLQKLIDADSRYASRKVRVVNLGKASMNTSEILSKLPEFFRLYDPKLALVMTGEPNFWNKIGYGDYLDGQGVKRANSLQEVSQKIAVVRFFQLLFESQSQKSVRFAFIPLSDEKTLGFTWFGQLYPNTANPQVFSELSESERREALTALENILPLPEASAIKAEIAVTIARLHFFSRNLDSALVWYSRAADSNSLSPDLYFDLKAVSQNAKPEFQAAFRKIFDRLRSPSPDLVAKLEMTRNHQSLAKALATVDPLISPKEFQDWLKVLELKPAETILFRNLFNKLQAANQLDQAMDLLINFIRANPLSIPPMFMALSIPKGAQTSLKNRDDIAATVEWLKDQFPSRAYEFSQGHNSGIPGWIESDLRKMAQEFKSRSVAFIFQNYPPLRTGRPREENKIIDTLCARESFSCIDLDGYFRQMPDLPQLYSNEFGPTDHHLNSEGYGRVAKKLFEEIKQRNILDSQK